MVKDRLHFAFISGADKFRIGSGDEMAWHVPHTATTADVAFQCLQPAIGERLAPSASCMVQDVEMNGWLVDRRFDLWSCLHAVGTIIAPIG